MVASKESLGRVFKDPAMKGADLTARLVLDDTDDEGAKGAGFGMNFYFADEAAARVGHDAMRAEVSEILDYPGFSLVMPKWTFRRDGSTVGGHLLRARVRPTLELMLTETPAHLKRKHDPQTGLALIRIEP